MPCGKEQITWETNEEKIENLLASTIAHHEGNGAVATESEGHYLPHQMDVSATNAKEMPEEAMGEARRPQVESANLPKQSLQQLQQHGRATLATTAAPLGAMANNGSNGKHQGNYVRALKDDEQRITWESIDTIQSPRGNAQGMSRAWHEIYRSQQEDSQGGIVCEYCSNGWTCHVGR